MTSTAAAGATPHPGPAVAARAQPPIVTGQTSVRPEHQQSLPGGGFDGMAVAAIGTGLTGAGWLVMLVVSRQLGRRSR